MKNVKMIDVSEFDDLVLQTYGKPYSFQQQDGCKDRGIWEFKLPIKCPEDHENDTVPEEVNGDEMGVSFDAWLKRDPKQLLNNPEDNKQSDLDMWYERNFYPHVDMIVNDLHSKGLLKSGKYIINIDW